MLYDSDAASTRGAETASEDTTTISFTTHSPLEFTTNRHIPSSPIVTQSTEIPLAASTQSELLNTQASHTPVHNVPEVTTSELQTFSVLKNTDSVDIGRDETFANTISESPENAQNLKSSYTDESVHSTNPKGIVSMSAFVTSAVTLEELVFEDVTSPNGTNSTFLYPEDGQSKTDGECLVILQHFQPLFSFYCCLLCLFALHVLFSFTQLYFSISVNYLCSFVHFD